jgi:putative transposase
MSLIRNAFSRLHYPVDIMAQCVRWYLAYALSLRNLEEMMAERGIVVDHSTLHRWVIRLVPLLDKVFRRHKRTVGRRWRMDETYIKVKDQWKYLYRAVDTTGQTIDFLLTAKRDSAAALRFFRKAIRFGITANRRLSLSIKVVLTPQLCPRSTPTNPMKKRLPSGKVST